MGAFDTVGVPCPKCGEVEHFQSKGGEPHPSGRYYPLAEAPADVLSNVNRHSPHQCGRCSAWFAVDEATRTPILAPEPKEPWNFPINDWYRQRK